MKLKKLIAMVLSVLILSGMVPLDVWGNIEFPDFSLSAKAADGIAYGDGEGITRAEWLHNLVYVFGMTVEEEATPDNYFSDLEETHTYYEDILLAVEFGVVDIAAGEALYPDEYATRDFAVSTLNFCLGYQLGADAEYTFADSADCSDPASAQTALNRGWVEAVEGNFCPGVLLTADEAEAMLTDAEAVLGAAVVDSGYESTYEFAEDVTVIPEGTEAYEDENGVVTITDCPETVSAGDKFAVYYNGIPVVYTATDVVTEDNATVITTNSVETDDAFETVDAQGSIDTDAMEIIPAEGVEVTVEEDNSGISAYSIKKIKNINSSLEINASGLKGFVSVSIKNPYIDYSVNSERAYVALYGETTISYGISGSLSDMSGISKGITLFTCNVAGVGSFDITVEADFAGSATGNVKGYLIAGVECDSSGSIRAVKSYTQQQYYTQVEASATVGLKASLGVTKMPVISAYVYAQVGVKAKVSKQTFSDEQLPNQCSHFAAYLFADYGASASAKFGIWKTSESLTYTIYDETNSPVRIVNHYEDGVLVPKCTRGNTYSNFFTKGGSRWSGCGWSGYNGAYGLNADGTPFALYTYTLDDSNNATITKYNGSSYYVSIPETIDGYTVVAIGSSAFANASVVNVVIPDTVTSIGSYAFSNCASLKTIEFSEALTSIDEWAFYNCDSLEKLMLPNNLYSLAGGSFFGCDSLECVYIPKSLKNIGTATDFFVNYRNNGAFDLCSSLTDVEFEEGITSIPQYLFYGCNGLNSITLPQTVTQIKEYAFYNCTNLQTIDIPDTVTSIGGWAFYNCDNLEDLLLPNNLYSLAGGSFFGCDSLKSVYVPKSLKSVSLETDFFVNYRNNGAFDLCSSLTDVEFEEGITSIPAQLFYGCNGLKNIVIPETVTAINFSAFYNCTSLEKLVLPESLSAVYENAFYGCTSLSDLNIPNSLKTIGSGIFENCTSLEEIFIPANFGSSLASYSTSFKGPFYNCSKLKTVKFEEGIKRISVQLFQNCTGLEEVTIPDTVITIYGSSFKNCTSIKKLNIPDSVKTIYDEAFYNCKALEEVKLSDNITTLEDSIFYGCSALQEIDLPESITAINDNAFYLCSSLKSIDIPDSVTTIGTNVFYGCNGLESVKLPSLLDEISSYMFYNCSSLKNIEIPETVETIQTYAFSGCTSLPEITIPETVKTIGAYAFRNCDALEKVYIPQSTKTLGSNAFIGCEVLSDITFADYSITAINSNTFKDCPAIEKIVLPKGLTTIGSQAFMNCTGLTGVTIPQSVTSIDSTAFSYPAKTTVYGVAGSYAETFAADGGFTFVDITAGCDGFALSDFAEYIVLERGETYRAEFITDPEPTTDIITLTSSNSKVTISGMDIYASSAGDAVITATTSGGLTYEFTVHVRAVSNIAITASPAKTEYIIGESLDTSGMTVTVNYGDGTSKEVTDYTVSGFDSSAEGESTVTVTWVSANNTSYTATFTVNVTDPAPKLTGIYVAEPPFRTKYAMRTALDTAGLVIMGTYTDGVDRVITDYTATKINTLKAGEQTITVTSSEFTCSFTVTVINCTSHTSGDWEIMAAPTADAEGVRVKRCTVCQTVLETEAFSGNKNGDIDGDGIIGASDIALMRKALLSGSTDAVYDINGDGSVTVIDLIQLKKLAAEAACGDIDGSGEIDSADVTALKKLLLATDTEYSKTYDTNADGAVTVADLIRLKKYLAGEAVTLG